MGVTNKKVDSVEVRKRVRSPPTSQRLGGLFGWKTNDQLARCTPPDADIPKAYRRLYSREIEIETKCTFELKKSRFTCICCQCE